MSVPLFEWTNDQFRKSGKSESGMMSTTPQIESADEQVRSVGVKMIRRSYFWECQHSERLTCLVAVHVNVERFAHPRVRT